MSRTAPPTTSAPAVFLAIGVLTVASFGASIALIAGAGRPTSTEPTPTPPIATAAPARTAAAQSPAAGRVRVVGTSGSSSAVGGGSHQVTFVWTLEGAREGDPVVLHFYAGNRSLGEQRGALDPTVFAFASGTFTLVTSQECSPGGWSAEIVRIRDLPTDGDSLATARAVTCE